MRIDALGESAYILRDLSAPAPDIAALASALTGVREAVPSYETVGVYVDPDKFDEGDFKLLEGTAIDSAKPAKVYTVPVCYEMGDDLQEASSTLGLKQEDLIAQHSGQEYTCFAVGFSPGFPYLGYLPEGLQGLGRRAQPRVRVPKGSVGITGKQTGIYPEETPGGWHLIGRTPLELVSLADRYFPIAAGDRIRFRMIGVEEFESMRGQRL